MARPQFIQELMMRKEQLLKELESIELLLADHVEPITQWVKGHTKSSRKAEGKPKGDLTWEEYIEFLIKHFGGTRVKSKQIADYAVLANVEEAEDRVRDAIRGGLSKMAGNGKLIAQKTKNRKAGFLYSLKAKLPEVVDVDLPF